MLQSPKFFLLSLKNFSYLDFPGDIFYPTERFFCRLFFFSGDKNLSGLFNVNGNSAFFNNFINYFSAGPDYFSDFFRINLQSQNSWSKRRKFRPWFCQNFFHFF